jgi:hypothetical protein
MSGSCPHGYPLRRASRCAKRRNHLLCLWHDRLVNARLVGYWSESELYPGSTEYTELGFRADGTGWQYWSSWSTEFVVHRFAWHTPEPGRLAVHLRMELDGTWAADNTHRVERREHIDTRLDLAWTLEPDHRLTLDRPLDDMLGGTRFGPVEGGGTDPPLAPGT